MLARHEVCRESVMTGVIIGIEIKLEKMRRVSLHNYIDCRLDSGYSCFIEELAHSTDRVNFGSLITTNQH